MAVVSKSRFRKLQRWVVPICAAPLLFTAATGSRYSLLLEQGIDAFWPVEIHTGRFGSGIGLLVSRTRRPRSRAGAEAAPGGGGPAQATGLTLLLLEPLRLRHHDLDRPVSARI